MPFAIPIWKRRCAPPCPDPSTTLGVNQSKDGTLSPVEWVYLILEAGMPLQSKDVDAKLIDDLVKKHFGSEFTCFVTRNHARGRYVKGDSPDAIGRPRRVLVLQLGYEVIGQFRGDNGDVLEFYRDTDKERARAFVEEYKRTMQRDLRLHVIG